MTTIIASIDRKNVSFFEADLSAVREAYEGLALDARGIDPPCKVRDPYVAQPASDVPLLLWGVTREALIDLVRSYEQRYRSVKAIDE